MDTLAGSTSVAGLQLEDETSAAVNNDVYA